MNRKIDLERRNALKVGGNVGLLALFAGLGLLHSGAALASGMTPAAQYIGTSKNSEFAQMQGAGKI